MEQIMIWPSMLFNICVGLLLAAYLLRAVRRFERRADAIMAKMDEAHAESMRKYDIARDEIRASMRARVDQMIAEMEAKAAYHATVPVGIESADSANGSHNGIAHHPDHPEASSFGS